MIIKAPAKVNLYLRVLRKRPDGYHNIETVFEKVTLFDKIKLRSLKENKIKVFSSHSGVPKGKTSLIYKTAVLLKKERNVTRGVEIKLSKRIPIAAGLGGGSSDAASILMGLNKLWGLSLSAKRLKTLGGKLGADIPFFLTKTSFAIGKGKGDKITPLKWKKKIWHLLICPPKKLLSKDIYKLYDKMGCSRMKRRKLEKINLNNLKGVSFNDLERSALKKEPLLKKLKDAFYDIGSKNSLVSGSGSSVFSIFRTRKEALRAKLLLVRRFPLVKKKGWKIFIVSTL